MAKTPSTRDRIVGAIAHHDRAASDLAALKRQGVATLAKHKRSTKGSSATNIADALDSLATRLRDRAERIRESAAAELESIDAAIHAKAPP